MFDTLINLLVDGLSVEFGSLPHLFEIVELTYFGTENMDDDVTCVDQHPIAARKTFDLGIVAMPALFQSTQKLVRNRRYMTMRTPRCNDHMISNDGLASKVDGDNIFSLCVFKTGKDRLKGERYGIDTVHLCR